MEDAGGILYSVARERGFTAMSRTANWQAIRLAIFGSILSGLAANYGQPFIHDNQNAINVIVTVFSILAGFLVAIIAIVGDPMLLPPGSWRAAEMERGKLMARLNRHKLLFYLYLVTLFFIFLAMLIPDQLDVIKIWSERCFLFFGVLAFTMSFFLPSSLVRAQSEKIDAIIEQKRKQEGIANEDRG